MMRIRSVEVLAQRFGFGGARRSLSSAIRWLSMVTSTGRFSSGCLWLLLILNLGAASLFAAERNIIFLVTDDQSPLLGCYGDRVAASPHADALAKDGTLFRNAFATTASCSPSRSVILSGMHNHANGQYGLAHSVHHFSSLDNVHSVALPRALAAAGYRTAQIGKLHVLPEQVYHFETSLKGNPRQTVKLVEACREFMTTPSEKPFFLYIGTTDPHRDGKTVETSPLELKPNSFGNPVGSSSAESQEVVFDPQSIPIPPFLPDTPECRAELAQYYQSCARIDRGLGRLIEILKETGLYDKTLIVFTSDHGIAMPGAKTTTYEPGLHVPFIVRNPYQQKRGIVSEALISHVDIAPSLLDFAGALKKEMLLSSQPPHASTKGQAIRVQKPVYHGNSWIPILGETRPAGWDTIYASHTTHEVQMYYPMRVVRDRQYKLIWNLAGELRFPSASDLWQSATWQAQLKKGSDAPYGFRTVREYLHRPRYELFDIQKDPDERQNLADLPEYRDVLKTYIQKLEAFQNQTADPWANAL